MGVAASIARILTTMTLCGVVAAGAFYMDKHGEPELYTPLLFTLVIILTNLDQIRINRFKALALGLILTLPVFFVSLFAGIGITQMLKGAQVGMVLSSAMSAGLMFLVNSLYFTIGSFKTGLATTAILGLSIPLVVQLIEPYLLGINSSRGFLEDPGLFFICWQTLVGLGISVGIWAKVSQVNPNQV